MANAKPQIEGADVTARAEVLTWKGNYRNSLELLFKFRRNVRNKMFDPANFNAPFVYHHDHENAI